MDSDDDDDDGGGGGEDKEGAYRRSAATGQPERLLRTLDLAPALFPHRHPVVCLQVSRGVGQGSAMKRWTCC